MQKRFRITDVVDGKKAAQLISKYGSPLYVYNQKIIRKKAQLLLIAAKGIKVSYALKANTNKQIVKLVKSSGIQYIDAVSPGEVYRALQCGYKPSEIMYTQNFISSSELEYALNLGVTMNIGAFQTLLFYKQQLRGHKIFVRINPKVGAGTSHHVITGGPKSKFGVYEDKIDELIKVAKENDIHIKGVHLHIGSNLKKKDEEVYLQTLSYIVSLLPKFEQIEEINVGGGLGVVYRDQQQVSDPSYLYERIREIIGREQKNIGRPLQILMEPGRFLVADSGVLLCTITARKKTPEIQFIGTDTGFNHLIRPALYGAYHEIINLSSDSEVKEIVTVCGNICESTDILGTDIQLNGKVGDILAIGNVGAYGFSMSSNYNERPKPAEVLINQQNEDVLIRRRQTFEDLNDKL